MLTQKLTRGIALTATIALLAGCPQQGAITTPSVEPSVSPIASVEPSITPSVFSTPVPSPTTTVSATPVATPSASVATQSTKPSGDTGTTSDIKDRATFNGKVYDPNQNPVDGATVTAKSVDAGVSWVGEATQTSGGAYVFRNAPVGARIEVSVTKDGWTTRTRSEVLKSNLTGEPKANTFDFGFDGSSESTDANALYAIQDEPEVTSLKINGKSATDTAAGVANKTVSPGNADIYKSAATTGVSADNLIVEMTFSEAVNKDDVQNYFRVLSTQGDALMGSNGSFAGTLNKQAQITIDRTYSSVTFDWSVDGKSVNVKTNKGILANVDGATDEARYLLDFTSQFRDLSGTKSDPKRTFRFSASKLGGFHLFSVKNQDQAPYITDFYAVNGASGSDYLKLKFNRPMDVVGRSALAAILSDPAVIPPVVSNNLESMSTANSTMLGFHDAINNQFVPVYHAAIMKPGNVTIGAKLNVADGWLGQNLPSLIRASVVDFVNPNIVIIELPEDAFNSGDKIIISAGAPLSGIYSGSSQPVIGAFDFKTQLGPLPSTNTFSDLTDPAGKVLDRGGASTSAGFPISNSQKIATAG